MYYPDRITDIVYFTTHALYLVIYPCYFTIYALNLVVNATGECQQLRCCHPNFLLRQFIQALEGILDLCLPQQLLQILLWSNIRGTDMKNAYGELTCSSLFYLLRRDSENIQNFHHYLHDDIRHCLVWSDLRIRLETSEKVLDTFKNVDQGLLRCIHILNCLKSFDVKLGLQRNVNQIPTWRRTPAPANITFAGEKTYPIVVQLNLKPISR